MVNAGVKSAIRRDFAAGGASLRRVSHQASCSAAHPPRIPAIDEIAKFARPGHYHAVVIRYRSLASKTITEPARQIPLYGEYEVAVLGGGPAGIAAAVAAARAGRRTLLIERYGFLGGMGTAAGVTNFCGLHANVHGEMHRVVQGVASDLLARIDRLDGLNAPHLILGKIFAQAYDTAAYKIAADDLLAAHKVDILFHALGAGVVMAG